MRIEAMPRAQEALPTKHLVDPWNAPYEIVGSVKDSRVGIRKLRSALKKRKGDFGASRENFVDFMQQLHRGPSPDAELPQKSTPYEKRLLCFAKSKRSQKVRDNVIVVPGIKGNLVVTFGICYGPQNIKGSVAVKRGYFNSNNILDFHEFSPELVR